MLSKNVLVCVNFSVGMSFHQFSLQMLFSNNRHPFAEFDADFLAFPSD